MQVIIIGAGGHGKVVADIVQLSLKGKSNEIDSGIGRPFTISFLDDIVPIGSNVLGYSVIGKIKDCFKYPEALFVVAIGDNKIRKLIAEAYELNYFTVIHPDASIGLGVQIEEGTVIMAKAVINTAVTIGRHCIVNSGVILEHDSTIENYVHISPGALLGGTVNVGAETWIGMGATIINNISISNNCIIGAGAVVIKDIKESGTYIGLPAIKSDYKRIITRL